MRKTLRPALLALALLFAHPSLGLAEPAIGDLDPTWMHALTMSVKAEDVKALLEPTAFTTKTGVKTIRPPLQWAPTVLHDEPASFTVVFNHPDGQNVIQVSSGALDLMPSERRVDAKKLIARIKSLYVTDPDKIKMIKDRIISGTLVKEVPITLAGIAGTELEIKRANFKDNRRVKYIVLCDGHRVYELSANVLEKDWATTKPLVETALSTLQYTK